jgi:hypothetical protein
MVNAKSDCSNFDSLPKLGFQLGDKVLNLMPDDYMDRSASDCSFSLMALDVPPPKGPLFIFGDPFLRRFVTIFDNGNKDGPRVGFAVSNQQGGSGRASELIADINGVRGSPATLAIGGSNPNAVALHLESGLMGGAAEESSDSSSESVDTTLAPARPAPVVEERSESSASSQGVDDYFATAKEDDYFAKAKEEDAGRAVPALKTSYSNLFDSDAIDTSAMDSAAATWAASSKSSSAPEEDEVVRMRRLLGQSSLVQRADRAQKRLVSIKLHRGAQ